MVEQTTQQIRVISFQAGPGEVDAGAARINDRAARAIGHQLAVIGDRLVRERSSRQPHWLPAPLHMLRPAQALTRTIYRDVHSQLWAFQGLSAAVKAWIVSTAPWQGIVRAEVSSFIPATLTGWTRGTLVTVALVAAVAIFGALWMQWKA